MMLTTPRVAPGRARTRAAGVRARRGSRARRRRTPPSAPGRRRTHPSAPPPARRSTRVIACAVSISDETTKSTSSRPSRQSSMYSMLEVRITVVARGASILANVAATRLASSRDVHAITRSASRDAGLGERATARAVRLDRGDVVAVGERRQSPRVEIDHGQVVLGVERLNDRGADLACTDDEDLHGGRRVHPPVDAVQASATVSCDAPLDRASGRPPRLRGARDVRVRKQRPRQAHSRLVKVADGLQSPLQVVVPPGGARGDAVRRPAGRASSVSSRAARSRPSRSSTSAGSSRRAESRGCSGSRSRPTTRRAGSSSSTTRTANGDTRIVRYRSNGTQRAAGERAAAPLRRPAVREPQRRHGRLRHGRPRSTSAWVTAAREAIRRTGPRTPPRSSARSCGSTPRRPGTKPTARGARSAQPLAVLVRPRERRPLDRRRRSGRDRGGRPRGLAAAGASSTSAGTSTRAAPPTRPRGSGPGGSSRRSRSTATTRGCSVTGGYVYRGSAVPAAAGRYFYGDYCIGTVWSLKLADGVATDLRKEPFTVRALTSFGEDRAGELYLVSGEGAVYRLTG